MKDVMGVIYTSRNDLRLRELTMSRAVAALPVLSRYRIIDFVLSSLVNSGARNVGVIMQKNYHSLMDHLGSGKEWDLHTRNDGLFILPPYLTRENVGTYGGMLDALRSNLRYLRRSKQEYLILTNSETVYNMNFDSALRYHIDNIGITKVQFGVGTLPQEVVAETQFASGADEQVRVGHEVGGQMVCYQVFVYVIDIQLSRLYLSGNQPCGACQFPFRRVAQGDDHRHAGVACGTLDALFQPRTYSFRQPLHVADDTEGDVVLHEYLFFDGVEQEGHQGSHFLGGTVPVLGGEGVESEVFHSGFRSYLCDVADRLHTCLVSIAPVLVALLGPSSVPIHDDGDVDRDSAFVDLFFI